MGFGGKVFPLVYSRAGSFASRSAQALVVDHARLQLFVDDPAVVAWGTQAQVDETLDLVVIWWLIVGLDLAWPKRVLRPSRPPLDRHRVHPPWRGGGEDAA